MSVKSFLEQNAVLPASHVSGEKPIYIPDAVSKHIEYVKHDGEWVYALSQEDGAKFLVKGNDVNYPVVDYIYKKVNELFNRNEIESWKQIEIHGETNLYGLKQDLGSTITDVMKQSLGLDKFITKAKKWNSSDLPDPKEVSAFYEENVEDNETDERTDMYVGFFVMGDNTFQVKALGPNDGYKYEKSMVKDFESLFYDSNPEIAGYYDKYVDWIFTVNGHPEENLAEGFPELQEMGNALLQKDWKTAAELTNGGNDELYEIAQNKITTKKSKGMDNHHN